jgi:hypothetical protein
VVVAFRGPNGGVEVDALGTSLLITILLEDYHVVFLAFFWGVGWWLLSACWPESSMCRHCLQRWGH